MSYVLPQVQVFQMFRMLPTATVRNLNAFVFGANYQLFRYAVAAEKALIGLGAYDRLNDTDYAYPNQPAGSTVDQSYVKLYMENVWAQYASISASAANPVVVVSDVDRNKIRAVPLIGTPANGHGTLNVTVGTAGGCFTGGVALPEDYAVVPYGGWVSGAWSVNGWETDLTTSSGEAGKMAYQTTEGLAGSFNLPADPLVSGTHCVGPDGLMLDLDDIGDSHIRSPLKIRFQDAGGTNYFDCTINWDYLKDMVDWDLDSNTPLKFQVDTDYGSPTSATWTAGTKTATLAIGDTPVATLTRVKAALEGNANIATYFVCGDIVGTASTVVTRAFILGATVPVDIIDIGSRSMIPDCSRVRITPNPYTFATGNGFNRSAQFKSRNVQVGDRVKYVVTDDLTVTHTGETKVVALEADTTRAQTGAAHPKTSNQASQTGDTSLDTGSAIVEAGSDNQRLFDGANTAVFALDAVNQFYPGELSAGILDDTFTVEITVPGIEGVAQATVRNASGTYYRTDVLIESKGSDDGQIYVGRNMYINFDKGGTDPDAEFQLGDVFTFEVTAPFTAVGATKMTASGTYTGPADTTYVVEVVRGGVFTRTVHAISGLQVPVAPAVVLTPSVTWADWLGGDSDDEYVLKCTTAGTIATAEFSVRSQNGDNADGVSFGAVVTNVALGGNGLVAQFDVDSTFTIGDYWVIKVNAARPQVHIYDTAGVDNGSAVVVAAATDFDLGGYGVLMQFATNIDTEGGFATGGGLLQGDMFLVSAVAVGDGAIKTLVLADDLPDAVTPGETAGVPNWAPNRMTTTLYILQASVAINSKMVQSPPDYNWEAGATEITVYSGIEVQDASWYDPVTLDRPYMSVYKADLYAEYRTLLATYADTIHSMGDVGEVATTLGTITPDNPLAQGVYNALINSGDRHVYYMAVPSDDSTGFLAVLDAASLVDTVYAFTPLTLDGTIKTAVEGHINSMSTESNKRWRIGFFGSEMPTEVAVYDLADNPGGEEFFATVTEDPANPGNYTIVKFFDADGDPSPYTAVLADVVIGDKVRVRYSTDAWGDATYDTYTVGALLTNTSLKLAAGPTVAISPQTKVEVWHDYTVAQMAEAVGNISAGYANRRIYNVFPNQLGAYGVTETAEFGAAAVAGLCSSVPPQQGLTNIELNGFDDLPMVYHTFNRTQLNRMAELGTLIIMQDVAGGRIYIRHQVSTAAADGNLNTTELSVTKNLDSISYYYAERLAPFIGRYNVTPELISLLETQIQDGLNYLGSFTNVGLLGPQVILAGTSIERVEQHPTLQDHVLAVVNVQLPYPLNVLQLYLVV